MVSWKQCLSDNQAWDTLTWFAALIAMASYLNKYGFIGWFSDQVRAWLPPPLSSAPAVCVASLCPSLINGWRCFSVLIHPLLTAALPLTSAPPPLTSAPPFPASLQVVGLVGGMGMSWQATFGVILSLYFYSHYFFASGEQGGPDNCHKKTVRE